MTDHQMTSAELNNLFSAFDVLDADVPYAVETGLPVYRHAAYGMRTEDLDIVVIDESRAMQSLIRSMLQPLKPRRLRIHSSAPEALRDMLLEPPSLVLTELKMEPMSGYRLLKVMRHMSMDPLCFVPIVAITAHATRTSVENLLRAGAHSVMVKPLSAAALHRRIDWVLKDHRSFVLEDDSFVIDGVSEILDARRQKDRLPTMIARLHVEHERAVSNARKAQNVVDQILNGNASEASEVPEAGLVRQSSANNQTANSRAGNNQTGVGQTGMSQTRGSSAGAAQDAAPGLRIQPPVLRASASRPILRPVSRNVSKAFAGKAPPDKATKETGKKVKSSWRELWS